MPKVAKPPPSKTPGDTAEHCGNASRLNVAPRDEVSEESWRDTAGSKPNRPPMTMPPSAPQETSTKMRVHFMARCASCLTYSVLSLKPGGNQAPKKSPKWWQRDKPVLSLVEGTCWTKPRSRSAVAAMVIVKRGSSVHHRAPHTRAVAWK
jgi:hypothetical protein